MSSDIFAIAGSALAAQNARMAAIASNLANADSVTAPGSQPYRAHEVVFRSTPVEVGDLVVGARNADMGVSVAETVQSNAPVQQKYDPGNPMADAKGYVTGSNVSQVGEMVNLIDSSNSYSASVAVLEQATRVDQQMISSFQVT